MKAMKAAKALKAVKAKKAAGPKAGKWNEVRSLQSRYAACSERLCGLDARYNGCFIWKQKLGMELHKLRFELGQKKEAPRGRKRLLAKTKPTYELLKERRERIRASESDERHYQQQIEFLQAGLAECDRWLAKIATERDREQEKKKKLTGAVEEWGFKTPEKRQKRQTLDDTPQLETTPPPSTPSTCADSHQNARAPRSAATSSTGDRQGSEATPAGIAPTCVAADVLGENAYVCDVCGDTGHLQAVGTFPRDLFAGPSPGHRLPGQTK